MDGKPQWQLKDRFKELTTNPKAAEGGEVGDPKRDEGEKKEAGAEEKTRAVAEEKKKVGEERKRAWEEKKKKKEQEEAEATASAGAGDGDGNGKAAGGKEERKIVFVDDGRFNLEEIVLVHKLAERYDGRKWLEVASKFFDTTGKRVHPDELREALSGGGT